MMPALSFIVEADIMLMALGIKIVPWPEIVSLNAGVFM